MRKRKPIIAVALTLSLVFGNIATFNSVTVADTIPVVQSEEQDVSGEAVVPEISAFDTTAHGTLLEEGACGESVNWNYYKDGTLYIYGEGKMDEYTEWNFCGLVYIHLAPWNDRDKEIKSIYIDEGITSVGSYSFDDCTNLTEVYIADTVVSIGDYAFVNCTGLTQVSIPGTVEEWGRGVFSNCKKLSDIQLSEGLTELGLWMFEGCQSITSIKLPESLTEINYDVFEGCKNLQKISIPQNVNFIKAGAFAYCSNLTEIQMGENIESIGEQAFSNCVSLAAVEIPDSVTVIEDAAFLSCSALETIMIPDSVIKIGADAFDGTIWYDAVKKENDMVVINDILYEWDVIGTSATIPAGIKSIGENLFANKVLLTDIEIPDSVTVIEESAFYNCISLANINIPDSVTCIGDNVFQNCKRLEGIVLPDSITELGSDAFDGCEKLKEVKLSNRLTEIASGVFDGCISLTEIELPDTITCIGGFAFYSCENIDQIKIPNGVTEIGSYAFSDCKNLTYVELPERLVSINNSAFSRCDRLKELKIPANVQEIDRNLFGYGERNVLLYVACDSYGKTFAEEYGYSYELYDGKYLLGDINMDGSVDLNDAQNVLLESLGIESELETEDKYVLMKADCDGEEGIGLNDANYILKVALGIIDESNIYMIAENPAISEMISVEEMLTENGVELESVQEIYTEKMEAVTHLNAKGYVQLAEQLETLDTEDKQILVNCVPVYADKDVSYKLNRIVYKEKEKKLYLCSEDYKRVLDSKNNFVMEIYLLSNEYQVESVRVKEETGGSILVKECDGSYENLYEYFGTTKKASTGYIYKVVKIPLERGYDDEISPDYIYSILEEDENEVRINFELRTRYPKLETLYSDYTLVLQISRNYLEGREVVLSGTAIYSFGRKSN